MAERKRQRVSLFDQPGDAPAASGSNGGAAAVFAAAAAAANGGLGGALASGNGGGGGGSVMNKYTGRPFSQRYYDILEKRKGLPVWQQRDDFIKIMNSHQTLVLVGETGSGKTTQVRGGAAIRPPLGSCTYERGWLRGATAVGGGVVCVGARVVRVRPAGVQPPGRQPPENDAARGSSRADRALRSAERLASTSVVRPLWHMPLHPPCANEPPSILYDPHVSRRGCTVGARGHTH